MPAPPVAVHPIPAYALTYVQDFAGGANVVYTGQAMSRQKQFTFTVTSVSKAGAASFSITGHGLSNDNPVVISGATGDWAACNGTWPVTVTGVDAFTIAVNSGAFSGSFNGVVTTTAPRSGAACWQITKNYYDTNNLIRTANADGSVGDDKVWANRASLTYA